MNTELNKGEIQLKITINAKMMIQEGNANAVETVNALEMGFILISKSY